MHCSYYVDIVRQMWRHCPILQLSFESSSLVVTGLHVVWLADNCLMDIGDGYRLACHCFSQVNQYGNIFLYLATGISSAGGNGPSIYKHCWDAHAQIVVLLE